MIYLYLLNWKSLYCVKYMNMFWPQAPGVPAGDEVYLWASRHLIMDWVNLGLNLVSSKHEVILFCLCR